MVARSVVWLRVFIWNFSPRFPSVQFGGGGRGFGTQLMKSKDHPNRGGCYQFSVKVPLVVSLMRLLYWHFPNWFVVPVLSSGWSWWWSELIREVNRHGVTSPSWAEDYVVDDNRVKWRNPFHWYSIICWNFLLHRPLLVFSPFLCLFSPSHPVLVLVSILRHF